MWTDAGRKQGDEYVIAENVSPYQAYMMQHWLKLNGWAAHSELTTCTDMPGSRRRPE